MEAEEGEASVPLGGDGADRTAEAARRKKPRVQKGKRERERGVGTENKRRKEKNIERHIQNKKEVENIKGAGAECGRKVFLLGCTWEH